MNAPDTLAPTAADRPAHAASPAHASDGLRAALSEAGLHTPVTGGAADAAFVGALLGHVFPEATGGGALSVSVREEAPGLLDLGAIDARTARRLVRALRF